VMQRDAEMIRRELNCNFVRCAHYPQTEAFLDACDELGLLVWSELPGWQFIGDELWQERALVDVKEMIRSERNHPSIVLWGVRVNESPNVVPLYERTNKAARELDDSRHTAGAMDGQHYSTENFGEDVFCFNDYGMDPKDYTVKLRPPPAGLPYLVTEAVGNLVGPPREPRPRNRYRLAGDPALQATQAIYHAQAHDQAGQSNRYSGLIGWVAFDYPSPTASYDGVKCPGVVDLFRMPKLGASFYRAQIDPRVRAVIAPNFYWDFGAHTPLGPGKSAAIFSNCARLEVFVDGGRIASLRPRGDLFPHLKYPPFFVDLEMSGAGRPELRIDGYLADELVLSRSFSSDESQDEFLLRADDSELIGDGCDATRLVFGRVDRFGQMRPFADKRVTFQLRGPGVLVGDNPFELAPAGGTAAVWIKTLPDSSGTIEVVAEHSALGTKSVSIQVLREPNEDALS